MKKEKEAVVKMRDASFLCQNRLPEECLQLMEFVEFGIFKEFVRKHSGGNIYMRVEKVNMRKETLLKVLKRQNDKNNGKLHK